jgi:hypothetical protein
MSGDRPGKAQLWAGRSVSAFAVLLLLGGGMGKLIEHEKVVANLTGLGFHASLVRPLGVVEVLCTVLYIIPRTSVLGALLLTAYLGGATACHIRVADGKFGGAVLVAVFVWVGLFLREPRVRALLPFRSED